MKDIISTIERQVYQLEDLHKNAAYEKEDIPVKEKAKRYIQSIQPVEFILNTIPILRWLPEYNWKKSIVNDIISGTTVAIIHIPQGFAYSLLANCTPIMGIYMAFFPVLVYTIFGTSRHISMGTFAIVCLMAGKVVKDHATVEVLTNGTEILVDPSNSEAPHITNIDVAVTLSFAVGSIMILMWLFRLGIIASLMSETMVSAFTCGSAFYVVAAQFKDILGLQTPMQNGLFSLEYTVYDAIEELPHSNLTAGLISIVTLIVLFVHELVFKPWLSKRSKIPLPMELIVIVIGTIVVYFTGINTTHDISIVGHIPKGMPQLSTPTFSLLPKIMVDAVIVAMVSYATSTSLALMFAKKNMYEVDCNQEFLGQGLSNLVGAFSTCLPVAACLSRSMIQESVGGVTQITGVVSSMLLLILLLWAGPVLETAPKCILACTIVVACKGLIMQVKDLPRYWRLSRWDGVVWVVTFFTTFVIDISIGLAVGVVASLISVGTQGLKPQAFILGRLAGTELYLDTKTHKAATQIPGLKIFRYVGGLNFASKDSFRALFVERVGLDPAGILRKRMKLKEKGLSLNANEDITARGIIIDMSSLTFIDPTGVEFLIALQTDLEKLGVFLYIACSIGEVYEVVTNCDRWKKQDSKLIIFPTVHDAVVYAQGVIAAVDTEQTTFGKV